MCASILIPESPRGTHLGVRSGLRPLRFQFCCFFTLPYLPYLISFAQFNTRHLLHGCHNQGASCWRAPRLHHALQAASLPTLAHELEGWIFSRPGSWRRVNGGGRGKGKAARTADSPPGRVNTKWNLTAPLRWHAYLHRSGMVRNTNSRQRAEPLSSCHAFCRTDFKARYSVEQAEGNFFLTCCRDVGPDSSTCVRSKRDRTRKSVPIHGSQGEGPYRLYIV